MYSIRDFDYSERDFADVVAVYNADWPDDPTSIELWQYHLNVRRYGEWVKYEELGRMFGDQRAVDELRAWLKGSGSSRD